jgi:hydroxyacylglutathione hydrolase
MFIEKFKSEGLAHLSYLVGDGDEAAVIDPRRDCECYIRAAQKHACRITHIFETHRNEDLVSGAALLSKYTGAPVHHGPNPAGQVAYAETTSDGDRYDLGDLRLHVLETPGHTDDSISIAVHDANFGSEAVAVFTGDALFVGDVGRTDFYPDRAAEVAGLLHHSLRKLFELGDQAIIHPAHGAGSVCGDNMADREFSTLGYERRNNPSARIGDQEKFIAKKIAEHHDQPPYFRLMEQMNLDGSHEGEERLLRTPVFSLPEFEAACEELTVVDVRGVTDFLGAHTPGALCIPEDMVPAYAGWLLRPEEEIVLIADGSGQAAKALRHLYRIGYDRIRGMLHTAMPGWAASARAFRSVPAVDSKTVAGRLERRSENWTLLDVRDQNETGDNRIEGADVQFLGELPENLDRFDPDQPVTVMCASGARATIGASILLRNGFTAIDVFLGSMGAWLEEDRDTVE